MARYLSWGLNLGLIALSCWFLAESARTVIEAWFTPVPSGEALVAAQAPASAGAPANPQVILARNLFNASILAPQTPIAAVAEILEATRLPLVLLGTAASDDPAASWAAIESRESQQTLVLRNEDSVLNQAKVVRIERKRVVLDEGGELRELAIEEPDAPTASPTAPPPPRAAAAARSNLRRPARAQAPPTPVEPPVPAAAAASGRTPAQLFQDARILPKYTEGQMVGVQVSSIKPGGIFEQMGLQDGDVITELNGIRIDSPEQSSKVLLEISGASSFNLQVDRAGQTVNVDVPAEP